MAKKQKKYYVVWRGKNPGVYDDWGDAQQQIQGFPNPLYKGFTSSAEAAEAFRRYTAGEDLREMGLFLARAGRGGDTSAHTGAFRGTAPLPPAGKPDYMTIPEIDLNAWAVDASCMGNPGIMEYRGVELMTGRELFRVGPFKDGTNNIGEFLAIVHALALMAQRGEHHNIYSDSLSGMSWVRNKRIKTTLKQTPDNARIFELMQRAMVWLNTHHYTERILKWQTELWGEIPADFGRK